MWTTEDGPDTVEAEAAATAAGLDPRTAASAPLPEDAPAPRRAAYDFLTAAKGPRWVRKLIVGYMHPGTYDVSMTSATLRTWRGRSPVDAAAAAAAAVAAPRLPACEGGTGTISTEGPVPTMTIDEYAHAVRTLHPFNSTPIDDWQPVFFDRVPAVRQADARRAWTVAD